MTVTLYHGDCQAIMPTLPANSIDSIVCDPPYGLSFMGKDWDYGVPGVHFWEAALRVAKPGAHLLAFGGDRTHHRMMCAIEDAGWELRTCLYWCFGSGFPKSHDISKAIDRMAGAEREVIGEKFAGFAGANAPFGSKVQREQGYRPKWDAPSNPVGGNMVAVTAPATDAAKQWLGWGTALKPAAEIIVMARKPLSEPTIAQNVLRWGTGALAIDKCRIGTNGEALVRPAIERRDNLAYGHGLGVGVQVEPQGRWPANLLLSEDAAALLDEMSGERKSTGGTGAAKRAADNRWSEKKGMNTGGRAVEPFNYGDTGGASRFFLRVAPDDDEPLRMFYCGKASKRDRSSDGTVNNTHPTCKPQMLMRWLARLCTPPGGTILDPFLGSGTTGVAAVLEGFNFVGIELESEYLEIARKRIEHAERTKAQMQPALLEVAG